MSFEGYYQILCKEGHEGNEDVCDMNFSRWFCDYCGAGIGWSKLIDQTNEDGSFDCVELEQLTNYKKCTCSCGYVHSIGPPLTYKIPSSD